MVGHLLLRPRRNYYLFEDHIGAAAQIGEWVDASFFWPADHTWRVQPKSMTTDSTFIGGTRIVDELCASEMVDVLEIPPDAHTKIALTLSRPTDPNAARQSLSIDIT
jgi:hypothetical protein